MQTVDPDPFADDVPGRPGGPLTPAKLAFRVVAGLVIAASFGVWVYAYSGLAERDAPDLMTDTSISATAEPVCAAALADVAAMPNALDAVDGADRADQIRATTGRFQVMLDELATVEPVDQRDLQIYRAWLDDWQVLLGDRLNYADRIATDAEAVFLITDTGVGERLDRRITRFANTNAMVSCASPTDV